MAQILDTSGRPLSTREQQIGVAKADPRGLRKCGSEGLCELMQHVLVRYDGQHKSSNSVLALAGEEPGSKVIEAVGFYDLLSNSLLLFNYCAFCGGKLKLAENKR